MSFANTNTNASPQDGIKYGFYDSKRNVFFEFEDLQQYNRFLVHITIILGRTLENETSFPAQV